MEQLYKEINDISFSRGDLLEVFDDFIKSNVYLLDNKKIVDLLSGNGYFLEQGMSAIKESIIVAILLFSLDERIDFENIFKNCIDYEIEETNILKLNEVVLCVNNKDFYLKLKHFFSRLRVNIFINVLEEQKEIRKMVISKKVYSDRYQSVIRGFNE